MTQLARYSADLHTRLERGTGVATGMRRAGSISLGLTADRREELLRQATLARAFGVEVAEISTAEVRALYPHVEVGDVTCAGESADELMASRYEIEVAGRRHRAVASLAPKCDPGSERVRMSSGDGTGQDAAGGLIGPCDSRRARTQSHSCHARRQRGLRCTHI